MAASSIRPRRRLALLLGLLLLALLASMSMGQQQQQRHHHEHEHEITATADQQQKKQERPRSDGSLRRLQRAPRTRRPTPEPTPFPTFKPLTRRPTPVPDPNAPTRPPRRTREPTAAPEFFEPGSGSIVDPSTAKTNTGGGATTTGTVDPGDVDASNLPHTPAPTPLPPPPPGGPSVDGAVGDITKAFDWSPVIYASVATGILVVVLITIAVMVRVLRVRTPLTPSIAPSDMGASLRSSGVGVSASHYSSQFSIEDIEPSRQGLPAATSASALHSPRTSGSGGSAGSPGGGGVDASLSATADFR